ncbi:hypothetical protein FHS18_000343 [Paenibacillus phyllosphaerae]|uniref:Uncharacterized protein n=1 Tax=Paenibacillus phyllosphaerae TaxID=274593 RepID=A0A7W5AT55_9BACL|nr:hypothetical protein [Paenibacillus phyllosphaerae]MBB3108315.1 hypothetical protein [Paenibacillus phyllosphaerae]
MKTNDHEAHSGQTAFLFNVDIMVEGETNAVAMERLLHILNQAHFHDFKIKSGVNLGLRIQELSQLGQRLQQLEQRFAANQSAQQAAPPAPPAKPATTTKAAVMPTTYTFFTDRMEKVIAEKRLIRLKVNRGAGVMLSIPCRVLSFDEEKQTTTVYHVDEKQVYTFKWTEIEDFIV